MEKENKKIHVPSLVLLIIGIIFAFIIPLIAYICCIVSLVMSIRSRNHFKTKYAIALNIVGILIALANHIYTAMMLMGKI